MDMNKKRKIRKENKNEREESNLKKGASINWGRCKYVNTASNPYKH